MNEFKVECYISKNDEPDKILSSLVEKDMYVWQEKAEVRALSEYYNKKIKVSKKLDN